MIDPTINRFLGISVRCNGEYSYRIVNPMLFYTNVCGNMCRRIQQEEIDSQLKSELLTALQPALARDIYNGDRLQRDPTLHEGYQGSTQRGTVFSVGRKKRSAGRFVRRQFHLCFRRRQVEDPEYRAGYIHVGS